MKYPIYQIVYNKNGNPEFITGTIPELRKRFRSILIEGKKENPEISINPLNINSLIKHLEDAFHELDSFTLYKTTVRWVDAPKKITRVKRKHFHYNSQREVITDTTSLVKQIEELPLHKSLILKSKDYVESRRVFRRIQYLVRERKLDIKFMFRAVRDEKDRYVETEILRRG
jgi:hypothetical protein